MEMVWCSSVQRVYRTHVLSGGVAFVINRCPHVSLLMHVCLCECIYTHVTAPHVPAVTAGFMLAADSA